jgi:hypothetical protein
MWRRYGVSWQLVRSSWSVLRHNSELLFFPLLTVVGASLMLGGLGWSLLLLLEYDIQRVVAAPAWMHTLLTYGWLVFTYVVGIYTNTALVAIVLRLFRGERPDFREGWRLATARLPCIFGYALLMATIGMIIRLIFRPAGFLGRLIGPVLERTIVFTFVGLAWHVIPYFVVPVIINEDVRPLDALQRSAGIIKRTWGNDVVVNASVWLIFTGPLILVGLIASPALTWATKTLNEWIVTGVVYALLVMLLLTLLFKMAMDGIFSAAVYEYATNGLVVDHFHPDDLRGAFSSHSSPVVNFLRRIIWPFRRGHD